MSKYTVKLLPVVTWKGDNETTEMTAVEKIILNKLLLYIMMVFKKMFMSSSLGSINILLYMKKGIKVADRIKIANRLTKTGRLHQLSGCTSCNHKDP